MSADDGSPLGSHEWTGTEVESSWVSQDVLGAVRQISGRISPERPRETFSLSGAIN
jgi:hypothetical protein